MDARRAGIVEQGEYSMRTTIETILLAKPAERRGLLVAHGKKRAADAKSNIPRTVEEQRPHMFFSIALGFCEQLREQWSAESVEPIEALAIAWTVVASIRLMTLPETWTGDSGTISNYFTRAALPPMQWIADLGDGPTTAQAVNDEAATLWKEIYAGYTKALS